MSSEQTEVDPDFHVHELCHAFLFAIHLALMKMIPKATALFLRPRAWHLAIGRLLALLHDREEWIPSEIVAKLLTWLSMWCVPEFRTSTDGSISFLEGSR